jgi:hypothetical protein
MTAGAALLAGCGGAGVAPGQTRDGQTGASAAALIAWPARDQWPAAFRQAAPTTQAAYRYALSPAGQALLRWMPCYCGSHETDGQQSGLLCR